MSVVESAAIVGLGLIGGSVARDLATRGVQVSGYDADPAQVAAAVRDGIVHRALDRTLAGVRDAALVVIAVPVDGAAEVLRQLRPHIGPSAIVTDVGSTKGRIVRVAEELGIGAQFVGSHPFAGDHRSGWPASRPGMFAGARVFVCPTPTSRPEAVELVSDLWRELGAKPVTIEAGAHDHELAWTSHLPYMVSTALALALARKGIGRGDLGPGGKDVTRLAGSSAAMWTAIASENGPEITAALAAAESEIAELRSAVQRGDAEEMRARFAVARSWFDAYA